MRWAAWTFFFLVTGGSAGTQPLLNPYERRDNGPPLTEVFHRLRPEWILKKLLSPRYHPAARMPDFGFTEKEALAIMAYLKSIAGPAPPRLRWPPWAEKNLDEMDDTELDALFLRLEAGKTVWRRARCSICHTQRGTNGRLLGGAVDLRVGGVDLIWAARKLRRDWLASWLADPRAHYPHTFMPRFTLDRAEREALVEYLLRAEAFGALSEEGVPATRDWGLLKDPKRRAAGRRLVEEARCGVCHRLTPELEPVRFPALPGENGGTGMGRVVAERRCLTCHRVSGAGGTYAPDWTGIGSRLRPEWVRRFLQEPDLVRPLKQQMPRLGLTAAEIEIVVRYFETALKDPRVPADLPGGPPTPAEAARGRRLVKERGCLACHRAPGLAGGVVGPDLSRVRERLQPGYVWYHLRHPRAFAPDVPEPDLNLTAAEARAVTAYLLSGEGQ